MLNSTLDTKEAKRRNLLTFVGLGNNIIILFRIRRYVAAAVYVDQSLSNCEEEKLVNRR